MRSFTLRQAEQEAFPCRHCDDQVAEHEDTGVWQHTDGRWRCAEADTLAEPEHPPGQDEPITL